MACPKPQNEIVLVIKTKKKSRGIYGIDIDTAFKLFIAYISIKRLHVLEKILLYNI